ncbi:MAG: hypothetical protein QM705_15025 [Ancrocorticia sp.]
MTLWSLVGSVALVTASGVAAMAAEDELTGPQAPEVVLDEQDVAAGVPGAQVGGQDGGQIDARSTIASNASDVTITVDQEGAAIGSTVAVRWKVSGGTSPQVTGMTIRSAIVDGPLMFWRDQSRWVSFTGGSSGFLDVTVPRGGNRMFVILSVTDGGRTRLIRSDYFSVSGFTGLPAGEWGEVEDTRSGQFGIGYLVNASIKKNWFLLENEWYYSNEQGFRQHGWLEQGKGTWYYLSDYFGVMQTGWVEVGEAWYYLNSAGVMQTGWQNIAGARYYLKSDGAMLTGWASIGGVWYYLQPSGAMKVGWLADGTSWYYFRSDGSMATGWVNSGGVWYYLQSTGAMHTGWLQQGGSWYYLKADGSMATGSQVIDGKVYRFASSGVWLG